ncbi:MAG: 16S rRNA (uracil(1498)-N(3))-methyltransferase, partial [Thiohalorhabdaceae bacterium]
HKIAAGACGQCGRNRLPVVAEVAELASALAGPVSAGMVLDEAGAPAPGPPGETPLHLLIGPEGGLTEEELATAEAAGRRQNGGIWDSGSPDRPLLFTKCSVFSWQFSVFPSGCGMLVGAATQFKA